MGGDAGIVTFMEVLHVGWEVRVDWSWGMRWGRLLLNLGGFLERRLVLVSNFSIFLSVSKIFWGGGSYCKLP